MYYMRAKVPRVLRRIVGKSEIVKSLHTKDFSKALSRVKIESLEADRIIAAAEVTYRGQTVADVSDEELRWMAASAFVEFENESLKRDSKMRLTSLDEDEREDLIHNRTEDYGVLLGGKWWLPHQTREYQQYWAEKVAEKFKIVPGTPLFERAFPLFVEAALENFRRSIDRAKLVEPERQSFRHLDATSILPPSPRASRVTLGALLDEFMDYQRTAHADTTPAAYGLVVKVLREELGNNRPLAQITKQDIERIYNMLGRVPVNAAQRYPNMPLAKAIAAADSKNDEWRLAPRTVSNYLTLLSAIFNYAVQEGYITENPVKSRKLREMLKKLPRSKKKALFADEQLNALFRAPLYTGCVDDEWRYMQEGPNHPKRGRFWVPLLGLFQGLRCNEACQLHTADVGYESGIAYIKISDESESADLDDKSLKNRASERRIPVHPELLRIGFMEFVEARRSDKDSLRLFPELTLHPTKRRYSHAFSKWFSRFVKQVCGHEAEASFHSLRHHFRTALMNAGVSTEFAEALGGWASNGSSEVEYRHSQLHVLFDALAKVKYPKVCLRHLYFRK
jgi:integrase